MIMTAKDIRYLLDNPELTVIKDDLEIRIKTPNFKESLVKFLGDLLQFQFEPMLFRCKEIIVSSKYLHKPVIFNIDKRLFIEEPALKYAVSRMNFKLAMLIELYKDSDDEIN